LLKETPKTQTAQMSFLSGCAMVLVGIGGTLFITKMLFYATIRSCILLATPLTLMILMKLFESLWDFPRGFPGIACDLVMAFASMVFAAASIARLEAVFTPRVHLLSRKQYLRIAIPCFVVFASYIASNLAYAQFYHRVFFSFVYD
jgi:hypothetical protein